ncbi:MAG: wax ester/triacylglycerol synthase domain-containing protein [Actinomycetes bacterium]
MQQLTGLDEMFLGVDTSTTTGLLGGLLIYQRPEDHEAGRAAAMRARIAERRVQIPPLRRRLATVPLRLDHAYWAEVDRIALEEHVLALTLPPPGNDEHSWGPRWPGC